EEEKETLYELQEQGIAELDEGKRDLSIEHNNDVNFQQEWTAEATHVDTVFDEDEEETTYEDRIEFEHDEITRYGTNEQVREIAEALDPMNFETRPYDEVTVDTDFDYNLAQAA
ncbi:MAG: hypothetical protein ABEK04_02570, partial [Candidatus Nanohalobium sp.]